MKLTEIILQGTAPVQTRALWAKPSDDGIVELKVFNNGAWQDTFTTPDLSPYMKISDFNEEIVKYLLKTDASTTYQTKTDDTLDTTSKAVVGAINELKSSVDSKATPQNITDAIAALDVETVDTVSGEVIKSVGQVDGKVVVEKKALGTADIPVLPQSKIQNLVESLGAKQNSSVESLPTTAKTIEGAIAELKTAVDSKASSDAVNAKQNATDESLQTSNKTIVGAINEILPKATGVGKVDATSDGTGEIFNSYGGAAANEASGSASHAEGANTTASASGAHAEGYNTTASGNYSHAEGYNTTASGNDSHSEGNISTASGAYSHAEGDHTEAFGASEHSEGKYNKSYKSTSASVRVIHSVGIGSSEDDRKNAHEIKFNGDHYVYGLGGYDGTNAIEDTSKTLQEVINSKQATITAGTGLEFEGNTLNVTLDTTVFYIAQSRPLRPAEGNENKICLVPTDNVSTHIEFDPEVNAVKNEYTEYIWTGSNWEELGKYYSEVDLTPYLKTEDAESTYLKITDAESEYATKTELAGKQNSTDDTLETTSKNIVGAINEILPKATGVGKGDSISDGTGEIFNDYTGNLAVGNYAHAEGEGTQANGECSHAEGYYSMALGENSHAEGAYTSAQGNYSHAEGIYTSATGSYSHAEGNYTSAQGNYSHAEGTYTKALNLYEHAEGSYNKSYSSEDASIRVIHSVGIGSSDTDRKNAHEIKFNGDHYVYGVGGFDGTNSDTAQTLQTVINGLQSSIRTRQSEQTVYTEVPKLTADYQIPANDTFIERVYIIPVGDTLYSVTGDSSILWASGIAPNPSANSVLVVSIVKNLATWNVFMTL